MMKKIPLLLLALVLCLSLCACSGKTYKTSSPDSHYTGTWNDDQNANRRGSLTDAEIAEKVEAEAIRTVISRMDAYRTVFDLDATRYRIGSIVALGDYEYEVSGTLYLYSQYGSVKGTATFTCSCIWISEGGNATSVGSVEVNVDY